nr:ABC transporter permease [Alphaproteobacteria bacterium]
MFSPFEIMVASRYLRSRRREGFISVISWFSLLGIALGVATLIIVMAVMNGFRAELFSRILGLNGHLNLYAQQGALVNYPPLADHLRKIPGVQRVTPIVEGQVLVSGPAAVSGALVRGIALDDLKQQTALSRKIVQGKLDNFKGENVAIGIRMAEKLNLTVGNTISLTSP